MRLEAECRQSEEVIAALSGELGGTWRDLTGERFARASSSSKGVLGGDFHWLYRRATGGAYQGDAPAHEQGFVHAGRLSGAGRSCSSVDGSVFAANGYGPVVATAPSSRPRVAAPPAMRGKSSPSSAMGRSLFMFALPVDACVPIAHDTRCGAPILLRKAVYVCCRMPVFSRYYERVYTRRVYVPRSTCSSCFCHCLRHAAQPLLSVDFYFPITE